MLFASEPKLDNYSVSWGECEFQGGDQRDDFRYNMDDCVLCECVMCVGLCGVNVCLFKCASSDLVSGQGLYIAEAKC